MNKWIVRIEFKPQDCWFGVFWKKGHVWICLLPMFPIHFIKYSKPRTAGIGVPMTKYPE